jgi:hypothetical protein
MMSAMTTSGSIGCMLFSIERNRELNSVFDVDFFFPLNKLFSNTTFRKQFTRVYLLVDKANEVLHHWKKIVKTDFSLSFTEAVFWMGKDGVIDNVDCNNK